MENNSNPLSLNFTISSRVPNYDHGVPPNAIHYLPVPLLTFIDSPSAVMPHLTHALQLVSFVAAVVVLGLFTSRPEGIHS